MVLGTASTEAGRHQGYGPTRAYARSGTDIACYRLHTIGGTDMAYGAMPVTHVVDRERGGAPLVVMPDR
eukprot:126964-Rhodomonas_salina.4